MLNFLNGESFTRGRAAYLDAGADAAEGTAKIFVRIEAAGLVGPITAQLDTGAAWSVLNVEIAEALGLLGGDGEQIVLNTRLGNFEGRLEQTTLTIVADEGESLDVDATVFVSEGWNLPTFIGYMGLLERIRFALDPNVNEFYFGGYVVV